MQATICACVMDRITSAMFGSYGVLCNACQVLEKAVANPWLTGIAETSYDMC